MIRYILLVGFGLALLALSFLVQVLFGELLDKLED